MAQVHTKSFGRAKGFASHYVKFFLRLGMLVFGITAYLADNVRNEKMAAAGTLGNYVFWGFVWIWFFGEMVFRVLPFKNKGRGCQKQYKYAFQNTGEPDKISAPKRFADALPVAGLWLISNIVIGGLCFGGIIDAGIVLLISLFYSVLDVFCVLIFCPFQTFIMKNRCCTTCRIYNWDYFLIFTPVMFTKNIFGWILFAFSLVILVQWETAAWRHPERFSEKSNMSLSCANCEEKLCVQKKQICEAFGGKAVQGQKQKTAVKF